MTVEQLKKCFAWGLLVLALSPFNAPFRTGPTDHASAENIERVEPLSFMRHGTLQRRAVRPVGAPHGVSSSSSNTAGFTASLPRFHTFYVRRRPRTIISGDYSPRVTVFRV
jgi:hypothetical protein